MTTWITGNDLTAVPQDVYYPEFLRDPSDALLKYGALPQRALSPYYTDTEKVREAMVLPDLVRGPRAVLRHAKRKVDIEWYAGVAHPVDPLLANAISPDYLVERNDWKLAPWHVHVDLGLNRGRKGDAAGIAIGRILDRVRQQDGQGWREVNRYVVPIVMQVVAPEGSEIYLTSISRFILQLRNTMGINLTSFSYDGWQSVGAIQELTSAGLVTNGIKMDPDTGRMEGFGKAWSVDRSPDPHQELKEGINEGRILLPAYPILLHELLHLEDLPGHAPDHQQGESKDTADATAGVIGYLAEFGHAVYLPAFQSVISGHEMLERQAVPKSDDYLLIEEDDEASLVLD